MTQAAPDNRPVPASLADAVDWVAYDSLLFASTDSPFRAAVSPGDPGLALIVGENASGKSLFFRVLAQKIRAGGALPVTLSIRERAGAGGFDMSRMRQAMIFGDETDQSTGATSVKAIAAAFKNLDRPDGSLLGLDEPELGLSDGYARALGEYIGAQSLTVPDVCAGVVVVTHSRSLVRGLLAGYAKTPTFVVCGSQTADADAWLDDDEVRSVEELLALPDVGLARFRQVHALLKEP